MSAGNDDPRGKRKKLQENAPEKHAKDGDGHRSIDQAMVKALSSPVRVKILDLLSREGEMSPKRISVSLHHSLGSIAYHVKVLSEECGLLELAKEVPKRGATEHFYRSNLETGDPRIANFQASIKSILELSEGDR